MKAHIIDGHGESKDVYDILGFRQLGPSIYIADPQGIAIFPAATTVIRLIPETPEDMTTLNNLMGEPST